MGETTNWHSKVKKNGYKCLSWGRTIEGDKNGSIDKL